MSDLPSGWALAKMGDLAHWGSGGTPKSDVAEYYGGNIPWVVTGDLTDGLVRTSTRTLTEIGLAKSSAKLVPSGTVLVAMYGASIGRVGIASMPLATNQAIANAQVYPQAVGPTYLLYYLLSQRSALVAAGKGAAQPNIGQGTLKEWPIPIAPLAEQARIIAAIEEQFSRLDVGVAAVERARQELVALNRSIIISAIPETYPRRWQQTTVGEAGQVMLGRQRSPRYHKGPKMRRYLRVANVFEDRIDTEDIMSMQFEDAEFARYRLYPDDILLNEGQSPHLLGRPAMYRGDPTDVAFTNSLLRFRSGPGVLPEWALLVFRRHLHMKRFMRESQITTNIAHLSAGRFKTVEFPVPPIDEQERITDSVRVLLSEAAGISALIDQQRQRARTLRSSVLAAAFSGKLVTQDANDEPASVLLGRIAAERASSNGRSPVRTRKPRTPQEKVVI